jgi:hypothetical protein
VRVKLVLSAVLPLRSFLPTISTFLPKHRRESHPISILTTATSPSPSHPTTDPTFNCRSLSIHPPILAQPTQHVHCRLRGLDISDTALPPPASVSRVPETFRIPTELPCCVVPNSIGLGRLSVPIISSEEARRSYHQRHRYRGVLSQANLDAHILKPIFKLC